MTDVKEISSVTDLRSTAFFDLFYAIFDAPNKTEVASEILQRIDPTVMDRVRRREKDGERILRSIDRLEFVKHELEERESARNSSNDHMSLFSEPPIKQKYSWTVDGMKTGWDLDSRYHFSKDKNDKNKVAILVKALTNCKEHEFDTVLRWAFQRVDFDTFYENTKLLTLFKKEVRTRRKQLSEGIDVDKELLALFLISKLDSDRDMIVFFGNNFHKAFEDVNAYTGLLYAYEYFEYVGLA